MRFFLIGSFCELNGTEKTDKRLVIGMAYVIWYRKVYRYFAESPCREARENAIWERVQP